MIFFRSQSRQVTNFFQSEGNLDHSKMEIWRGEKETQDFSITKTQKRQAMILQDTYVYNYCFKLQKLQL